MITELSLEERAALEHACQALHAAAGALYAAGLTAQGEDAALSREVIRRLLNRDLNTD